jgi:sugar/nucleoside kinase (ribokinase family)
MLSIDGTLFAGAGLALVRYISWNRAQKFGPKITVIGDVECHIIADRIGEIPDWGDQVYVPNPPSVKAGGSCLNTAIWLRNLSHSFCVTVPQTYSRVGVWTEVINQSAQKAFLNVVPSSDNESLETGTSLCLAGSNERSFIKYTGANAIFKLSDFETDLLVPEKTRHIHFGGYFNCPGIWGDEIISFIKTCRQKGVKTISLNPQYTQDWDRGIYSILPHIDFFICNKHEAITITDVSDVTDAIQELSKLCNCIVVTLGEDGALLMRKCVDLRPLRILCKESTEISFEDTIGVGDAFCAGFISEIVSKNLGAESPQLVDAVRFACACGTAACTVTGGSTFPGTQTIRECLID